MNKYLFVLFCFVSFATFSICKAQQDLTLHFMQELHQSNSTNPALFSDKGFSSGFDISSNIGYTGFTYSDMFRDRPQDDSIVIDIDNVLSKLDKINYIYTGFNIDLFIAKLKIRDLYITTNVTEKFDFRFSYPKDFIQLLWKGNGSFEGKEASFEGIGFDFTHYREFALGLAYSFDEWTIGTRYKRLYGMSNINVERSKISLFTDTTYYPITAKADYIINFSGPQFIDTSFFDSSNSMETYLRNEENKGSSFDIGFVYKPNSTFDLAVSVIDLFGHIKWNSYLKNYYNSDASFTFEGMNINEFFTQDSLVLEKFADSLATVFTPDTSFTSYKTKIPTRIFVSGTYKITATNSIGVLLYKEYASGFNPFSLSLSYNKRFWKIWHLGFTYSFKKGNLFSLSNLGLGSTLKLGPFQTFFVADNFFSFFDASGISTGSEFNNKEILIPIPKNANNFNFRFGFNLTF